MTTWRTFSKRSVAWQKREQFRGNLSHRDGQPGADVEAKHLPGLMAKRMEEGEVVVVCLFHVLVWGNASFSEPTRDTLSMTENPGAWERPGGTEQREFTAVWKPSTPYDLMRTSSSFYPL